LASFEGHFEEWGVRLERLPGGPLHVAAGDEVAVTHPRFRYALKIRVIDLERARQELAEQEVIWALERRKREQPG
jgi:hypothetical protein